MSPEDPLDRLERLHDALLKSYGALEKEGAVHGHRLDEQYRDITTLQDEFRRAAEQMAAALRLVDEQCEQRTQRIEQQLREQATSFSGKVAALHKKMDADRDKREWTVKEKVVIYAAIAGPMVTAALMYMSPGAG